MSNVTGDIYEVTIEGQYYGLLNGQKQISPYTVTVKMDDKAKEAGFLSVARNYLLASILRAKYPEYRRFRTHEITGVVNLSRNGEPVRELVLMNRKEIVAYIAKKKWPIDSELYPEVSDLRQAIRSYRDNREMFLKNQEKRRLTRGDELKIQRALAELNNTEPPDVTPEDLTPEELSEKVPAKQSVYGDLLAIPELDDEDDLADLTDGI